MTLISMSKMLLVTRRPHINCFFVYALFFSAGGASDSAKG